MFKIIKNLEFSRRGFIDIQDLGFQFCLFVFNLLVDCFLLIDKKINLEIGIITYAY